MGQDQRRYPRASTGLDVTVETAGCQWQGKAVDLSPYGVKVAPPAQSVHVLPGMCVRLRFAPRDEALPFSLSGTVVRVDSDGIALNFDPLGDSEFQRLKNLVGSFLLREWQEVLTQCEPGQLQGTRGSISNEPLEDSRATSGPDGSEQDGWQGLLNRLGLDLKLPSNGRLSRQWQEFLKQLEADAMNFASNESVAPGRRSFLGRKGTRVEDREEARQQPSSGQKVS